MGGGGLRWELIFHNFSYILIGLTLKIPTYSNQMIFYDLEYYSSINSLKWLQFQVFAPFQRVTINGFKWNSAFWNE